MGVKREVRDYYPFGLQMAGISSKALDFGDPVNKKKYNGIEYDSTFGIDEDEAQLRNLDPQTGRWWEIDPKVDDMEMWSPYASNYDNPIRFSDPDGDEGDDCCRDVIRLVRGVMISASGVVNGALNTATLGAYPTDPFHLASRLDDDEEKQLYQNSISVGQLGGIFLPGGKKMETPTVAPEGAGVGFNEPVNFNELPASNKVKSNSVGKNPSTQNPKGLGNPFKDASLNEVRESFEKRAQAGTMEKKGPNAYVNKKSRYSYNIDKGGNYGRGGKKVEQPHVDVNYPNPKPKNVPPKKKLDVKSE